MRNYVVALLVCINATSAAAQTRKGTEIAETRRVLEDAYNNVKLSYYDPKYHGLNLDSLHEAAKAELSAAVNTRRRYQALAHFLAAFGDPHTYFVVQSRLGLGHYHVGVHFYGDVPIITRVDPGSHAEQAGVRVGDQVIELAHASLTLANQQNVLIDLMADTPQELPLQLRSVDGALKDVTLLLDPAAKDSVAVQRSHAYAAIGDRAFVWRLPQFYDVDKGFGDVARRARSRHSVIIDLRGNPGGSFEKLANVLGYFVDHEVAVGKYVAKPRSDRVDAKIFVLIDSETASAAEVFARILQLQGKATVIGDRSAGSVMTSRYFPVDEDMGSSITVADFVLFNGERLEGVGVTPDIRAVETPRHVAEGGDPVLTLALLRAGVQLSPMNARHLFDRKN